MSNDQNNTKEKKERDNTKIFYIFKLILVILLVVGVGMFSLNQTYNYFYKQKFLSTPCNLCLDLNPNLERCFDNNVYSDDTIKVNYSALINLSS